MSDENSKCSKCVHRDRIAQEGYIRGIPLCTLAKSRLPYSTEDAGTGNPRDRIAVLVGRTPDWCPLETKKE